MKISFPEKKDNFARIAIDIEKADYQEAIDKKLRELRRTASIKGFRKGQVPMGMVKKMYGDSVKIDEVQNVLSQKVYEAIQENKLRPIGQTVLTPGSEAVDITAGDDFSFSFDLALIPPVDAKLDKEDKLPYFVVEVSDEDVENMLENALESHSTMVEGDTVEEDDIVRGTIAELEGDLPKEGGIRLEESAMLFPKYMKNEDEKNKFMGAAKNSVVIFSPYKAYDGKESEIASLLHIEKEEVEKIKDAEFSFEITTINRRKKAELNQEFYDKMFGEGKVSNEEEARKQIREYLGQRSKPDANYIFLNELKKYIEENKISDIELAEDTIKAWWKSNRELKEMSDEQLNKFFPRLIKDLKVNFFMDELSKKYEIKVSDDDVKGFARNMVISQFMQYGMDNIPNEVLDKYTEEMLSKNDQYERIRESISEQMIADRVRNDIELDEKKVSQEECDKVVQEKNEEIAAQNREEEFTEENVESTEEEK